MSRTCLEAGAPKPDLRMFRLCEEKSGCSKEELAGRRRDKRRRVDGKEASTSHIYIYAYV